jgi:hypothetical protein
VGKNADSIVCFNSWLALDLIPSISLFIAWLIISGCCAAVFCRKPADYVATVKWAKAHYTSEDNTGMIFASIQGARTTFALTVKVEYPSTVGKCCQGLSPLHSQLCSNLCLYPGVLDMRCKFR